MNTEPLTNTPADCGRHGDSVSAVYATATAAHSTAGLLLTCCVRIKQLYWPKLHFLQSYSLCINDTTDSQAAANKAGAHMMVMVMNAMLVPHDAFGA